MILSRPAGAGSAQQDSRFAPLARYATCEAQPIRAGRAPHFALESSGQRTWTGCLVSVSEFIAPS